MTLAFQPRLVNSLFGDPCLFVGLRWMGRAVLFDLGRLDRLPAPEVLKIRYVFVSHTHMDHFIGFDHLLRLFLARDGEVDLFGPPGVIDNVLGKLRGYTWNLVEGYGFVLTVHEVGPASIRSVRLPATRAFAPEPLPERPYGDGTLLRADGLSARAVHLDHRIVSLGHAIQEDTHLNVRTDELERLAIPPGPWLNELKAAIRRGDGDEAEMEVTWRTGLGVERRLLQLGDMRRRLIAVTPGQKLVYVTDTIFSAENVRRIVELARDADVLYCESLFVDEDRDQALKRFHLTARQAGTLGRLAGVKRLETFHFSPRYEGDAERLQREAQATFAGQIAPDEPV
jgi:ribonuclease Z